MSTALVHMQVCAALPESSMVVYTSSHGCQVNISSLMTHHSGYRIPPRDPHDDGSQLLVLSTTSRAHTEPNGRQGRDNKLCL
jgi:hypothetical protein